LAALLPLMQLRITIEFLLKSVILFKEGFA